MKKTTWKVHPLDNIIRLLAAVILAGIGFNLFTTGKFDLSALVVGVLCVLVLFPKKKT